MKKPLYEVRDSPVHGKGVFAVEKIKKGTRIVEYTGERISTAEGNKRYQDDKSEQAFVLLFTVNKKVVIDGGVGGSDAKYINHSCDPNCEAVLDKKKVFIEAIRDIQEGEELNYDYAFEREKGDNGERDKLYACRCGAASCRGSMLVAPKERNMIKEVRKEMRKEIRKEVRKLKKQLKKDASKKLKKAKRELRKAAKAKKKGKKKK